MVRNSVLRLSYQIPSVMGAADAEKPISVFRSNLGRKLHPFLGILSGFYPSSKSYPMFRDFVWVQKSDPFERHIPLYTWVYEFWRPLPLNNRQTYLELKHVSREDDFHTCPCRRIVDVKGQIGDKPSVLIPPRRYRDALSQKTFYCSMVPKNELWKNEMKI